MTTPIAYSAHPFHACDSRTHEAALFKNIFKFCKFLSKFSNILPFFAIFLKNQMHAVLSRIGPDT